MTLKNASFLAFIGTFLATALVTVHFFDTIMGVVRGIIPAIALVPCIVYFFAGVTVTVFFWVFARSQR